MKKMFAVATLALGTVAAAQSVQAAPIDGDGNFVPGAAYATTVQPVVVFAYSPNYVVREAVAPWDAFAAVVVPVKRPMRSGIDGDGNPVPGAR